MGGNGAAFAAQSEGIETVVVTATKRATNLQTTPIAVTALDTMTLTEHNVQTVQDIAHLVPSLQATTQGDHGVITLTLRGVGNDLAKTEYADPEVAMYIDGVYSPRAEGAAALLYDLSSIEVLRGPQGTLWGRNSTAGAVNIITAKPTLDEQYGTLEIGGGNYAALRARGAVNLPIDDTFALRVAFAHEQHDGYVDFQNPNPQIPPIPDQLTAYEASGGTAATFKPINTGLFVQKGPKYNAQDQSAVRVTGLWQPTNTFTWNLGFEYFADRGTPDANLMQDPRPGQKFWSTLADTAPYLHRDAWSVRSRMDLALNDYLNLAYVAGFSDFRGASDFDQDGGTHVPTSFATGATYQDDRTNSSHYVNTSHELDLQSSGSHEIDWIAGLYYGYEDNSIRFDIPIFNGTPEGTVGWQGSFIQPKETVDTKAAFAQATWNIADNFRITGGLRFTDDNRTNQGGTNNAWAYNPTCPQVPLDPGSDPRDPNFVGTNGQPCFTTYQHNDADHSWSKLTYLGRAEFNLDPSNMIYASISSGYKSGGLQDGGALYDPETLTNYEVGIKSTLFDGRATFNNAFFYDDFKGYQLAAPITFPGGNRGLGFWNVGGTTTIYGLESELFALLTDDDQLQLQLSLLHTELGNAANIGSNDYGNLPSPCPDPSLGACKTLTGFALPHAPSVAITAQFQHTFHLGNGASLIPRATVHWEDSSWLSVFHDGAGDKQDSYTRTDLGLRYEPDSKLHWYADAYVQNIEDGKIKTNAGATGDNIYTSQYLPPRTFGVNLGVRF
ncbi:MAG TPA: TonB-dependent receptor [Rhizomicrobium sp.]|nr:TonB-dependent receptor [Rhizomicrobium sp.]